MPHGDLSAIESTVKTSATSLTNLFNIAAGPTAIIGAVADGIFKGIQLGRRIQAAQREANAGLKEKILARGILRTPIVVDLTPFAVRSFYRSPLTAVSFPALPKFFGVELEEFKKTRGSPSRETWDILKAAKELVPVLKNDPNLDQNQDLQEIFALSLNPSDPDVRELVLEFMRLFPERALMYESQYVRLESFWKDKLELELSEINREQIEAQAALDAEVSGLIKSAIFDPTGGFASMGLDLAKKLRRISLQGEIDRLDKTKNDAPDKAAVDDRIKSLKAMLQRIGT